jgi:hypothetical protein
MDTETATRDSKTSLMKPRRTSTDFISWKNKHHCDIYTMPLNLIFSEHISCIFLNKNQNRTENFPTFPPDGSRQLCPSLRQSSQGEPLPTLSRGKINIIVIYIPMTLNLIFSEHLFCIFFDKSDEQKLSITGI